MMLPSAVFSKPPPADRLMPGIKCAFGYADLGILRSHLPLRLGHVRATLQHVRRHANWHRRRRQSQRFYRHAEAGSRNANQGGNRVFKLRPLPAQQRSLRSCGVQQRFLLRHVQPGGNAAGMAVLHQR